MKKFFKKENRGITLVALVITIILLLILAGISIQAITNQGIFAQANRAINEQTKASMKEQIAMYVSEATYDYYLNNPEGKAYLEFIVEYLEKQKDLIIDIVEQNEDEVIFNYTQGKNIVQILLSSDGTIEIIGSGTTSSGIEDTYPPKISYDASTTSSITVTLKDSSSVEAYICSLENTKPSADSSLWNKIENPTQTKQITITGLTANQTYYIFAKDTKGNISEGKECKTIDYIQIEYTAVQNGSNFTITVTSDTNNIMYQINDGEEKPYTTAFLVPSGSTVYLWNSENRTLTEKSKTVLANVVVTYKESSTSETVLETISTKHTARITLISKPSSLNKEGYDFIGWAESENAEEALSTEYTVPNYDVTLYPVWKKSGISISLKGAVGETISIYDGGTLLGTTTLNSSGVSPQNITLPAKTLKFVGSISGYEKTIEVTNDVTEVKVMPDGTVLYWYGNEIIPCNTFWDNGSSTKNQNYIVTTASSVNTHQGVSFTKKINVTTDTMIHTVAKIDGCINTSHASWINYSCDNILNGSYSSNVGYSMENSVTLNSANYATYGTNKVEVTSKATNAKEGYPVWMTFYGYGKLYALWFE